MPNKDSHAQLFEALSKDKIQQSTSTNLYMDKVLKKKREKEKFIEQVLLKTQHFQEQRET